ncbi:hypothetical protein E2C01_050711 [Portunus trituberculatus]|uniref:Uncharacterized protein n=1 Tax=Portunus trituberculatus TaxID=210409 RepID=A0A5B7GH37_PORTR|nr:hypothetical protein [Portunus trituberculatus]
MIDRVSHNNGDAQKKEGRVDVSLDSLLGSCLPWKLTALAMTSSPPPSSLRARLHSPPFLDP